jgi:dihydrofolate reductase
LPGRRNIIISRQKNLSIENTESVDSLEGAINLLKNEKEIMIIGGASVYEQALPMADQLYLTYINVDCEGDAFFPEFNEKMYLISDHEAHKSDEKNPMAYEFLRLVKR